ncbi:MAG: DNA primase, partial [Methylococcales bacterium]
MSGRIPREFIDELLVRVDIVDLIDSHVPLKKAGANFIARCPFHTEKTPSFSVNRHKQFFHCFGCGASGNAISFLMDFSHLDFVESIEELAAFAGLEVPRDNTNSVTQKKDDLSSLYALMERVAALYAEQLHKSTEGKTAAAYLDARGVNAGSRRDFMLGYAPDDWQFLANRFDPKLLISAGLLTSKDGGQHYDRFRKRLIFPIRDKRARIVGFGGRVLDDSLPKYLNSPETALFHKGKEVYGLFELLEKTPKPERIVLVEGYMDVITLAQYGIDYAVAALGTAASQAHLDLLFRFSSELVFCFDGDKAGRAAAWRAMEPAFAGLRDGRQIRIMLLPEQHDPDSLLRTEGGEAFINRIQNAATLSDYFFNQVQDNLNLSTIEGRAQLVNKSKPYLEKLPEGVFKDMMSTKLQQLSGAKNAAIFTKTTTLNSLQDKKRRQGPGRITSARTAIALLVQNPKLAKLAEQKEIEWDNLDFPGIDLFKHILQTIQQQKPVNTAVLLEVYRNTPEEKTVKTLAFLDLLLPDEGTETEFTDALDRLVNQARTVDLDTLLA